MKRLKYTLIVFLLFTFWSCSDWSGTPDNEIRPVTFINEIKVTPDTVDVGEKMKLEVSYRDQDNSKLSVYWSTTPVTGENLAFKREKPSYLIPINGKYDSSAVFFDSGHYFNNSLSGINIYSLYVYVGDTTRSNPFLSSSSRSFLIYVNH